MSDFVLSSFLVRFRFGSTSFGHCFALTADVFQNGQPYIRSVRAGPAKADPRSQGYTFAAISVFDSLEDMQYYDNGCAAHAELRGFAQSVHEGAMVVYFEDALA